jgi:hypothetical protein
MDIVETIGTLIEYGLSFAVMAAVVVLFVNDTLTTSKSRDREVQRERLITDKALEQVDGLTDALKDLSTAWERRNEIEQALRDRGN